MAEPDIENQLPGWARPENAGPANKDPYFYARRSTKRPASNDFVRDKMKRYRQMATTTFFSVAPTLMHAAVATTSSYFHTPAPAKRLRESVNSDVIVYEPPRKRYKGMSYYRSRFNRTYFRGKKYRY